MTVFRTAMALGVALAAGTALATSAMAQAPQPTPPEVVPPPMQFATSTEHYEYLRETMEHTVHTGETVPQWLGLWQPSYNNIALRGNVSPFFVGDPPRGLAAGGEVALGVLTPEYEAAFIQRRENMLQYNEQPYDRLTTCEPAGMPRWLLEPYMREWANTPTQLYWLNDLANDTRRIYIDQEHMNVEGSHSPNGDSIGFWSGETLVVHTVDVWPMDYFRGYPPTSNMFEAVEVYTMTETDLGTPRLEAQITFYDEVGLLEPLNAVYTWVPATAQQEAGYRIRHWDCDSMTQVRDDSSGSAQTNIRLPGESGRSWQEMRNPDLPPDLPGQTRTPGEVDFDTLFGSD